LPTIRSRCQNLALRPIGDADVRAILAEHDSALADTALERAVFLACGRPRRAFETLALQADSALGVLQQWLADPLRFPMGPTLALADALGADPQSTELSFAREMLLEWIADQAHTLARQGGGRMRLASANELWDKANALLAGADDINLDMKQTLVTLFDAIRQHLLATAPVATEST
jgi:DNA polymerase-3 subunit delta'